MKHETYQMSVGDAFLVILRLDGALWDPCRGQVHNASAEPRQSGRTALRPAHWRQDLACDCSRGCVTHEHLPPRKSRVRLGPSGQVFWLPDRPTSCAFPPETGPGRLHRQWHLAAFVPGYSGGTATALHRFPYSSAAATSHSRHPQVVTTAAILSGDTGLSMGRRSRHAASHVPRLRHQRCWSRRTVQAQNPAVGCERCHECAAVASRAVSDGSLHTCSPPAMP